MVYTVRSFDNEIVNLKRNQKIIRDVLLPDETLDSIAKVYGLTRERVRQIVSKGGISYGKAKRELRGESTYFRCQMCGKVLFKASGRNKFCSIRCRELFERYDYSQKFTCQNCQRKFYPFYNWKWKKSHAANKYCSTLCYFEAKAKNAILSERFVEKLKEEFAKREDIAQNL